MLNLGRCALQVNISFEYCHFEVIPGFGTLTTGGPSCANTKMFVGESDRTSDFHIRVFGIAYELVGHRLHSSKLVSGESDPGSFDFLILQTLFLSVLLSHILLNILINN